jgi:hypothetical protein
MTVPVGTSDCEYVEVGDCPALLNGAVLNVLLAGADDTVLLLCADASETILRSAVSVFMVKLVVMNLICARIDLHANET